MKTRKKIVVTTLTVGLLLGFAGPVHAAPPPAGPGAAAAQPADRLPQHWTITGSREQPTLTWRAPAMVPMGDATVEFYAGDRLLGQPRQTTDLRTFHLDMPPLEAAELSKLEVRAAGRRIDAPGVAGHSPAPASAALRAATAAPAAAIDPGVPGPYRTITGEYALDPVPLPGLARPVEMQAVVVAPADTPVARPLALFLHGRHFTCFAGADPQRISGDWPCPPTTDPVPSHRGYLQAQQLLASQGYITVSISANGINAQDLLADGGAQARSSLVRLHLAHWAQWAGAQRSAAPEAVRAAPPADMSKVLLVGHSRGGEGVNRAAMDSLTVPPAAQDGYRGEVGWTIRGMVLVGPTNRGHNPVPDVPSVTILPGCDGDVADLQGQMYVDGTRGVSRGAALHAALYVVGANHNFFNTEWTPGQATAPAFDDFVSPDRGVCTPGLGAGRLTATQQQNVGATYLAAAARLFIAGDDGVRPLLDGSAVRAPSADPARVLSHAVGAAREPLLLPASSTRVTGARLCAHVTMDLTAACQNRGRYVSLSPHFASFAPGTDPDRYSVMMNWSTAGQAVTVQPATATSIKGSTSLAMRLIVPENSIGTSMDVAVTDTAGHRARLGTVSVDGLPSSAFMTALWGQEVRVPLTAAHAAGLDLDHIATLELIPRTPTGQAFLIDAWGWRAGTPAAPPVSLPRVDVGDLSVDEGGSGTRTVHVPVQVSGRGTGTVRLFLTDPDYRTTTTLADITPNTRGIEVPITVTGNNRYGMDRRYLLNIKTLHGAVIGDYDGDLLIRDDDPMPNVTVTPAAARVAEGSHLRWQITPDTIPDRAIYVGLSVQAPTTGAELSTTDVDPTWLRDLTGQDASPSRALSSLDMRFFLHIPPDTASVELTLPTIKDEQVESEEKVQLQATVMSSDFTTVLTGPVATGAVTD
ncbi:hypothetical protein FHX34_10824 [Actinoplanes teichomyceticus]|uniref:Secreted protein n=2 Tax=Actinoplanes teichomyceticus TaxID=1867 RepID=A0A561VCH1_ACTTI|nr:hypothetical protein FHX34_10824 [Actinoplanes teichomyceticus]GIF16669.1 hypothetical protein Ate01nite_67010 [Actinoplanes teichomyceticus]